MRKLIVEKIISGFSDFLHLIYPKLCLACGLERPPGNNLFCFECLVDLPYTNQIPTDRNKFMKHFYNKIKIESGAAIFQFNTSGKIQGLIHSLKYQNMPWIAEELGLWYARKLIRDEKWPEIDLILPIPLSKNRFHKRGYNQSAYFAKGLSLGSGCHWQPNWIKRIRNTPTQTGLSRIERYQNVKDAFKLNMKANWDKKHILLVDDVLTTGATLASCAESIQEKTDCKISMMTIAQAQ